MALAFVCGVALLFTLVLVSERHSGADEPLRPPGLLRWALSGNWTAKLGALLLTIGSGALLRYLMLNLTFPPSSKILSGAALAALFAIGGAVLAARPARRAISLALTGASLAVAYLTAYSAYAFFHFVADPQALGLLFIVAAVATVVAVTRRSLSIAVLAMVGAYLAPAFALHTTGPVPVYGYYAAVSGVTLGMVWLRGWRPLIHLSFLFTLGGALFFAWTQKFYTADQYGVMQPLLLLLVAIHLAMPLLERGAGSAADGAGAWVRRFDQAYFLLLPLVAAVLTLILAPHLEHEGARGLLALAALWLIAAGGEALRARGGAVRYLAVTVVLLLVAGWMASTALPLFLIAAVLSCLAVAAAAQLKLTRVAEMLALGTALASSACYVLQSVFAAVSGVPLLNLPFAEHLLLAAALAAAAWSLRRREQALAPVVAIYAGTWLFLALARELLRLHFAHVAELAHLATLLALVVCIIASGIRRRAPNIAAIAIFGLTLLVTGIASASRFPPQALLPLLLAGQALFSVLALACDRYDAEAQAGGAIARSVLPILALPWAVALSQYWLAPNDDLMATILVSSALLASLQAQWLGPKGRIWPNWLSPIGFTLFACMLFYESLWHIEREAWAVAFELLALLYLVESARFLWISKNRDGAIFGYVATAAVAAVSAAMLLRVVGPPGTLTVLALKQMVLPAVLSLVWAAIGAALTWLSTRKHSRMLWSVGALLMLAAALKLILLDFGSLGQIANILAMMAAGAVFLLVAWLAPFPPKSMPAPAPARAHATDDTDHRGWLWITGALLVLLTIAYQSWAPAQLNRAVVQTAPTQPQVALAAQPASPAATAEDSCQRFARALPTDYLVFGAGDSAAGQNGLTRSVQVNAPGQNIVLALGAEGPTTWQISVQDSTNVVAVMLSGIHRSGVVGLPDSVPVLHAARDEHAPCGYFQIGPNDPQGANGFVSRLLVHAVDANFQASSTAVRMGSIAADPPPTTRQVSPPSRIQIDFASYSSARNGRSYEVTSAVRQQCYANEGFCNVRCGNQLASDPDFGFTKVCQITYACSSNRAQTVRVQEGMNVMLRCD